MNTKKFLLFTVWIIVITSISINCSLINTLMSDLALDNSSFTTVTQEDLDAYRAGQSVETELQAVISARCILREDRISWVETPETVFVDRLSYQEAISIVEQVETTSQNDSVADDEQVWLVMFRGKMTVIPPQSKEDTPHMGCVYAILDASDGAERNSGGISCEALDLNP
jgi:hypothetical protein